MPDDKSAAAVFCEVRVSLSAASLATASSVSPFILLRVFLHRALDVAGEAGTVVFMRSAVKAEDSLTYL